MNAYLPGMSFLAVSFLIAGIPFGYLVAKFTGLGDIRKYGSGNIGATNVWRILGAKYGILTFFLDGSKSFIPVFLARSVMLKFFPDIFPHYFTSLVLFFTVAGHIFSPWLGWHGGKGVSSFILGLLALNIPIFSAMVLSWLLTFFIFHISGFSALMSVSVTAIGSYFTMYRMDFYIIFSTVLLIFWAHRGNIKDLAAKITGNENSDNPA